MKKGYNGYPDFAAWDTLTIQTFETHFGNGRRDSEQPNSWNYVDAADAGCTRLAVGNLKGSYHSCKDNTCDSQ